MNVSAFIRKTASKTKATIYFRVRDVGCDIKAASELSINPSHWDCKRQGYKTRVALVKDEDRLTLNAAVQGIINEISRHYYKGCDSEWLKNLIFVYHHPEAFKLVGRSTVEVRMSVLVENYIESKNFEKRQATSIRSLVGKIGRYEEYQRKVKNRKNFTLCVDTITAKDLQDFYEFLVKEHTYYNRYPELYKNVGKWSGNVQRSDNTLRTTFSRLRTIIRWCIRQGITDNNPFDRWELPEAMYGTPFFLSLEERDRLLDYDLSANPHLKMFRDMFVFQSLIGCRFGDLLRIRRDNVIDGVLEYIPQKTINRRANTVRVPLNDKAMHIFNEYKDYSTLSLFPHYNVSDYNNGIREAMRQAGINRLVTVIDPVTRRSEQRPLYEVATSHTARKTFIGNLYRMVKDPNLISSMSGHAPGSSAFIRYRSIDDSMKVELVNMIN